MVKILPLGDRLLKIPPFDYYSLTVASFFKLCDLNDREVFFKDFRVLLMLII